MRVGVHINEDTFARRVYFARHDNFIRVSANFCFAEGLVRFARRNFCTNILLFFHKKLLKQNKFQLKTS